MNKMYFSIPKKITYFVVLLLLAAGHVSVSAQFPNFEWAKRIGGTSSEEGRAIAVDDSGNVYTTGYFNGTVDFDPGPGTVNLTAAGTLSSDIFISKSDGNGNYVWAKRIGGAVLMDQTSQGRAIAVDDSGNVYTAGSFNGTADFDPGPGTVNFISQSTDIFICKLDADGNYVWAKQIGGTSTEEAVGIAVDTNGNVYTTGRFQGTVDFDPGPGTAQLISQGIDIFISKLDANGNYVWAKQIGGTGLDAAYAIALDNFGNVYTTGSFVGTVDFDPGPGTTNLVSQGTNADIFISKLDATGNYVWAKRMGGPLADQGNSIAVDNAGNVYTTGSFNNTANFDPGSGTANLTTAGGNDIFISKLDAAGNYVWAKRIGGTGLDQGNSIAVDNAGNVYTTGIFQGTADFDPGPGTANLTATGSNDIFISKLDVAGNYVWAKRMGSTNNDIGYALAVDNTGIVYTTGSFIGTVDFDPVPDGNTFNLTATASDIFIHKMTQSSPCGHNYATLTTTECGSFTLGSQTYTTSGTYTQILTNAAGCDSTVTLNLTIRHNTSSSVTETACDSFRLNGHTYIQSGIYTQTRNNAAGCDSVITLNLTINHTPAPQILTEIVCSSSFTLNGQTYTQSGTYTQMLTTVGGCDSVILLDLTTDYTGAPLLLTETVCGDSFSLNGQTYTQTGIYTQTYQTTPHGCDSIVTLDLTLNPIPDPSITQNERILTAVTTGVAYQWLSCGANDSYAMIPGATQQTYTAITDGRYALAITSNGCSDTSACIQVTDSNTTFIGATVAAGDDVRIYPNPANNIVHVTAPFMVNISISSMDGKILIQQEAARTIDISRLAEGMYLLRVTGSDGRLLRVTPFIKTAQ